MAVSVRSNCRQLRRVPAEEPAYRLLCFKRKEGEGGEAGFHNPKPTRQTYLFRHVTGGLTTKWAIEIQLKHLRIMACFDFVSRIKGVATFTTYLWFPHKGVEHSPI